MKFYFSLSRTRVQSTLVTIEARSASEAELLLNNELDKSRDPYETAVWSDGENEGSIDYELEDDQPGQPTPLPTPHCDMVDGCREPVTMLDAKGYVYCTVHGLDRRGTQRCRKLRTHELNRLRRGEQVTKY